MRVFPSEPLHMSNGPVFPCPNSVDRCSKPEEMTLQGETESKPVGSRTDTVARGVQCLIKFIGKPGLNLCQGGPYDLVRKVVYPYAFT